MKTCINIDATSTKHCEILTHIAHDVQRALHDSQPLGPRGGDWFGDWIARCRHGLKKQDCIRHLSTPSNYGASVQKTMAQIRSYEL